MIDAGLARAMWLANAREERASRPMDADDWLRALLDDDQSDASRLLAHLGLDPAACRATAIDPGAAVKAAIAYAREIGDVSVRTDHALVTVLAEADAVALRAAVAERAARPLVVPEPAGPPPRLPGAGASLAVSFLVLAVEFAVLAAMAWRSPLGLTPLLLGYGGFLGALAIVPRIFPITTQRTIDRVIRRIGSGRALVPVAAPVVGDTLLTAGMHRVETLLRVPDGSSPSSVVVHGRVTWMAFERALLSLTGAPYMVAYVAVMAGRRSAQRQEIALTFGGGLLLTWPVVFTQVGVFGLSPVPLVVGMVIGVCIFVATRWWETFATIRTAAAWAGPAATHAWFAQEARYLRSKEIPWTFDRFTMPPFRLRRRAWAGPAGVNRAYVRWHRAIRRAGGTRCDRKQPCEGAWLVNRWLAGGRTLDELHRRLDAAGPDPAGELAVWFEVCRPDTAAEVLARAGVVAGMVRS